MYNRPAYLYLTAICPEHLTYPYILARAPPTHRLTTVATQQYIFSKKPQR